MKPATIAVHAGHDPPPSATRPIVMPIVQSSVFTFTGLDEVDAVFDSKVPGYIYSRFGHPNATALEAAVAGLEGTEAALATASGNAAVLVALLAEVGQGDHIVAAEDIYGGTFSLITKELARLGVGVTFVDAGDLGAVGRAIGPATRILYVETISNPTMRVADLPALGRLAASGNLRFYVDNTFATPVFCRPAAFGAHAVLHSVTKYLAGHGDVVAGAVAGGAEFIARARAAAINLGPTIDPFAAWLAARGIRTLALRLERQAANALAVAEFLARQPAVERVNYPGLPGSPEHERARLVLSGGFGGMVSFALRGGERAADAFIKGLSMIRLSPSLGDVYTTVSHPAKTSHRGLPPDARDRLGVGPGLIRLSAGIEDVEDIAADLARGLRAAARGAGIG